MMRACLDVHYRDATAVAACVLFEQWTDAKPSAEHVARIDEVEPYMPGQFFRRELPSLLAVLRQVATPLEAIVIDGYVWLADGEPGLGARLYEALEQRVPVIGVAKTPFLRATNAREVARGSSVRPLFVSAVGMELDVAAERIREMHGTFRIPTLLKLVDRLSRRG